jgi:hypothetical protein
MLSAVGDGMGACQSVGASAVEPDSREGIDPEAIGKLGYVVGPITHAPAWLVSGESHAGPVDSDESPPMLGGGLGQQLGL